MGATAKSIKLTKKQSLDTIGNMLKNVVKESVPNVSISNEELNIMAQLCAMSTVPTGDEDPRALLRGLSTPIIDGIISDSKRIRNNPVVRGVFQLFFIEWCFRHDHLHEDWKWSWDSSDEGKVKYRSKQPLEVIAATALAQ